MTSTTAVKQDLVISAYKPNGGLEDLFNRSGATVESAWDFVQTHLKQRPAVKVTKGDTPELLNIVERDPRRVYDRMASWFTDYVRHGYNQALAAKQRHISFLMILMQRRVTSSTAAIRTTLERRQALLDAPQPQTSLFDTAEIDEWAELDGQTQVDIAVQTAGWLPTLTSVSRQALFSGLKPREFSETIESTSPEPTQWSRFWQDQGLRSNEILYRKGIKRTDQLDDLDE